MNSKKHKKDYIEIKIDSKRVKSAFLISLLVVFLFVGIDYVKFLESEWFAIEIGENKVSHKEYNEYLADNFGEVAVTQMIEAIVLKEKTNELGIIVNIEEVENEYEKIKNEFGEEDFQNYLLSSGYTEGLLKEEIRKGMALELVIEKTYYKEGVVEEYYEENKEWFELNLGLEEDPSEEQYEVIKSYWQQDMQEMLFEGFVLEAIDKDKMEVKLERKGYIPFSYIFGKLF